MIPHRIAAALLLLLLAPLMLGVDAPPPEKIDQAVIAPPGNQWILIFYADGRVRAVSRIEPTPIEATLPAGSVRFDALVAALQRLRSDEKIDGGTHAGLHPEGAEHVQGFYLRDDTLPRYLVASFADQWTSNNPRFPDLLNRHPIYTDAP